jgi:3-hydroxybutyryl-CoA dehydrogenase
MSDVKAAQGVEQIGTIGIAGAGIMGGGIAQLFAQAGRDVLLWDSSPAALERALSAMRGRLEASASKGHLLAEEVPGILARVRPAGALEELAACGLFLEAIPEQLQAKRALLTRASAMLPATALIGSNTSSLSILSLSRVVRGPERFLGIHFFNPPTRMELVELVPTDRTAASALAAVRELLAGCGKTPLVVRDSPGFIVNRLLLLMINEAARMVDDGVASAEDIDTAMRLGALHPAGPLTVADLIGLDTCRLILKRLARGLHSNAFRPARGLERHVRQGRLGRKSGQGFHLTGER